MTDNGSRFVLRELRDDDRTLLFEWRNRPEIVHLSSSRRAVTAEEHDRWFATTRSEGGPYVLIVEVDGAPAGQVRFDIDNGRAEISIYLLDEFTGRGIGPGVLRAACARATERLAVSEFVAHIRDDNQRSMVAFEHAGFCRSGNGAPDGHVAYRLEAVA